MTFDELMDKIKKMGITRSAIEKYSGFYGGKLTELIGKRQALKPEYFNDIANGLEALAEDILLLSEQAHQLDTSNIGQYSVYELTFPDGKKYYGMSINPEARWNGGDGYKTQEVGKAIREFGWANVEKRIIAQNLPKENAKLIERTLIKATGSDMPGFGYNIY